MEAVYFIRLSDRPGLKTQLTKWQKFPSAEEDGEEQRITSCLCRCIPSHLRLISDDRMAARSVGVNKASAVECAARGSRSLVGDRLVRGPLLPSPRGTDCARGVVSRRRLRITPSVENPSSNRLEPAGDQNR
ncbi:hypothetical protein AAFF_G00263000 [Aldrovandia affinis]|uniref:Uncharacterized protein n=1 Tax=Aldrovandia affinis TaxID=143900 RepID=A0AAD7WSX0_9TELE|nr:hypothetical protein AAFF_G00263000 [Aldrovandia affinis]